MGWQRSTLKLEFQDPQFEGLEVRATRLSIGDSLLIDRFNDEQTEELLEQVIDVLGERLISWNYDDVNGMPVEPSPKGVRAHVDSAFLRELIVQMKAASRGVPAPLETPSTDGETTQEPSIPMELLPDSQ